MDTNRTHGVTWTSRIMSLETGWRCDAEHSMYWIVSDSRWFGTMHLAPKFSSFFEQEKPESWHNNAPFVAEVEALSWNPQRSSMLQHEQQESCHACISPGLWTCTYLCVRSILQSHYTHLTIANNLSQSESCSSRDTNLPT